MKLTLGIIISILLIEELFSQGFSVEFQMVDTDISSPIFNGNSDNVYDFSMVYSTEFGVFNAMDLRIFFGDINLGEMSYINISSLKDNIEQRMNMTGLVNWKNTSMFFNGDSIKIELFLNKFDHDIFFTIDKLFAGFRNTDSLEIRSICGEDDRIPDTNGAICRIYPAGCTGWITSNGLFVSAGHCYLASLEENNGQAWVNEIMEFNVPLSEDNGTIQHPGPEDQYNTGQYLALGGDWMVFDVQINDETGIHPFEAQDTWLELEQTADFSPDEIIRISGYGADGAPEPLSDTIESNDENNKTLQTATGNFHSVTDDTIKYIVDTMPGTSGGPIIRELNGKAVGVHTKSDCIENGYNYGTSLTTEEFWNAIHIFPEMTFTNRLYGIETNLGGTLSAINHNNPALTNTEIPSGESILVGIGNNYTIQTNHIELFAGEAPVTHYMLNQDPLHFQLILDNYLMNDVPYFNADFFYQYNVNFEISTEIEYEFKSPWHVINSVSNPDQWDQPNVFLPISELSQEGNYKVFKNHNPLFIPSFPMYSLKTSKLVEDTENEIYFIFNKWIAKNLNGEIIPLSDGTIFNGDEFEIETNVVFTNEVAAISPLYYSLFTENGISIIETNNEIHIQVIKNSYLNSSFTNAQFEVLGGEIEYSLIGEENGLLTYRLESISSDVELGLQYEPITNNDVVDIYDITNFSSIPDQATIYMPENSKLNIHTDVSSIFGNNLLFTGLLQSQWQGISSTVPLYNIIIEHTQTGISSIGEDIHFENIEIRYSDIGIQSNSGQLSNMYIHNCTTGALLEKVMVQDSKITKCLSGVIFNNASETVITKSEISNNILYGLILNLSEMVSEVPNMLSHLTLTHNGFALTITGTELINEVLLFNSIIAYNSVGYAIYDYNQNIRQSYNFYFDNFQHNHELDFNNSNNITFDANPQFINIEENNFHLSVHSPCIDAGGYQNQNDPDGTDPDIGAYYFPQLSGIISQDLVLENEARISGQAVISEGNTLTIQSGTDVYVNPEAQLIINGHLLINGNENHDVTFLSNINTIPPIISWDGIIVNGNAEINYTNISNASTGINFTSASSGFIKNSSIHNNRVGVSVASGDVLISNNIIENNENIGIRANFSSPTIFQNEIHQNGNYGIFLGFGSQAKITKNHIYENGNQNLQTITNAGITIIGSSPELYLNTFNQQNQTNYPVNNQIYNNFNKGIYIDYNSAPNLGVLDQNNSPLISGGFNHFYYDEPQDYHYSIFRSNGLLNQINPRRNDIFAQWNYWHPEIANTDQPNNLFGDQIIWDPTAASLEIFYDDDLIVALIKEQNNEIEDALVLYNEYINTQPDSDNLLPAIDGMCRCYEKLNQQEEAKNRLEELRFQTQNERLRAIAKDHLIWSYKKSNLEQEAIDLAEELILEYTGTTLEAYYMLELALLIEESEGTILGKESEKKTQIEELGVILANEYPVDISTEIYHYLFNYSIESEEKITIIPDDFRLAPVHPNPFNPITNITYDVPVESSINISIYDLAGRKLEDLVNTSVQAGRFNTTWNAEKYSSGVYFVTMLARKGFSGGTAPSFTSTQKVVLLK